MAPPTVGRRCYALAPFEGRSDRVAARVGADIGALCRKCGDVWHVVIALDAGAIAQVECKQCGARHRYRPAPGERTRGASSPGRRAASVRKARSAPAPVVEADPSRPPRSFRPSDTYQVGDRVVHAHFGEGVVQAVRGPTKVEVLFSGGARTLVHGRAS